VEFLLCLLEGDGEVVLKEELLKRVWPDSFVEESSLAQTASLIRKALKPGFGDVSVIETVPRRGYRLSVPATPELFAPEPPASTERPASESPANDVPVDPPSDCSSETATREITPSRRPAAWIICAGILASALVVGLAVRQTLPRPISVYPLTAGTGEENDPDISREGARVVYSWRPVGSAHFNLYVKPVGGGAPVRVTDVDADDLAPTWSPDSSTIAFSRLGAGTREIRVVSYVPGEARTERLLLATPDTEPHLAWSPDGKWLAYRGGNPGETPRSLALISLQTSEQKQLTSPSAVYEDFLPAFSPDGRSIAFGRYNPVSQEEELCAIPAGGGAPVRIAVLRSDLRGLAWSQDGREIVFASNVAGSRRLFRVSASGGSAPQWIEAAGFDAYAPSIAQTAKRMAFTRAYQEGGIWRVPGAARATGPSPAQKWIGVGHASVSPQYSTDGRRVAFISDRSGSAEVWAANADGSNPRALTSYGETASGSPAWSPDGRLIAFDRPQLGERTFDIFILPAQGGNASQFTSGLTVHHSPTWSHDGNWIYFSSAQSGAREIWRQPSRGGPAQQITRSGGYVPHESADGKYVYFTKAADPGVWRIPCAGGAEEPVPAITGLVEKGYWTVTSRGYYWFAQIEGLYPSLLFFDFATQKTRVLMKGEQSLMPSVAGISVSPGDEWVLFTLRERMVRRIMLAEGFK
jgi:Tol biopolymer transport system component/DNA-binding winged helix-turn-helix (wHTH) protein